MHLYFCCVWLDVSEKRVYCLWFTKGKLAFSMLVQMANCYQRFLQHCLQGARRLVWKYITAWFHRKGQLLLPGFIKYCPPRKRYLSSSSLKQFQSQHLQNVFYQNAFFTLFGHASFKVLQEWDIVHEIIYCV